VAAMLHFRGRDRTYREECNEKIRTDSHLRGHSRVRVGGQRRTTRPRGIDLRFADVSQSGGQRDDHGLRSARRSRRGRHVGNAAVRGRWDGKHTRRIHRGAAVHADERTDVWFVGHGLIG
jgi:hypothetical protein